jgi:hypothetical protein
LPARRPNRNQVLRRHWFDLRSRGIRHVLMHILAKYPTRGRPQRFLETLRGWIEQESKPGHTTYLCNYDDDDATMTPRVIQDAIAISPMVQFHHGPPDGKIAACNAHIDRAPDWDICLLISDDMFCRRKGWDEIIRARMRQHFLDTDGCLWFHDGSSQRVICTLSCVGRKYYERDHYLYHPSYKSFFCDNEFTDVAKARGKIFFTEEGLCTHEHPAWGGGMQVDDVYRRNNKYWSRDSDNYIRRKAAGFPA